MFPKSNVKPIKYLHILVMLGLMLFVGRLTPPEPLTQLGMQVIGVFLGMVWGWLFVDLTAASILGIIAIGLTPYTTVAKAFGTALGNDTAILLIFILAIAGILDEAGLTRWIALKIMSAKVTSGHPWVLTAFVMLAAYVCALGLSPTASMMVVWTIIYGMAETAGYKKGEKWAIVAMVGAFMMATLAGVALPFKGMPAVVFGVYASMVEGAAINSSLVFVWMLVVDFVIAALYLVGAKLIVRPDVKRLMDVKVESIEKLTSYQSWCLIWFVVYIIFMFLPSLLPSAWAFTKFLSSVGNTGISAAFLILWLVLKFKECPPIGKVMTHVAWPVIFCVAAAMTVAGSFMSEDTGISAWLVQATSPLLSGKGNLFFIIALSFLVIMITQLCNNIATASMIGPIAISLVTSLGLAVNIKAALLCLIVTSGMAILLPSGSAMSAVLHSNKEWIPGNSAYGYGLLVVCVTLISIFVVGIPLAALLFPL